MAHKLLRFFKFDHLRGDLQLMSAPFGRLATDLDQSLTDSEEKDMALRKLLEAKDCAVRALLLGQDHIAAPGKPKTITTIPVSKEAEQEAAAAFTQTSGR